MEHEPCPGARARTAQLPFPGFCCGLGKGQIRVSHAGATGREDPAGGCRPGAANMAITVGGNAARGDLISGRKQPPHGFTHDTAHQSNALPLVILTVLR